ncbi:multicopper oxidase family protein [Pilimelia columellifera]|uniref:multicopper oxidase family protein n=1 Tax=Pilimelia columellifera TaxID=706574 RepID=UPI0031CFC1EF
MSRAVASARLAWAPEGDTADGDYRPPIHPDRPTAPGAGLAGIAPDGPLMARRHKVVMGSLIGILLVCCGGPTAAVTTVWGRAGLDTAGAVDFEWPLAIPPLAPSRLDAAGRRVFDLTAAPGTHEFAGRAVSTWGYNGGYLGPTLRARRGEKVLVNIRNALGEPTTVHWHGMRLPAVMDGGPHQPIAAGATWSPSWTVDQPAATLWYHPHLHHGVARQVYRGLAGMFLLDDDQRTGLPSRYGVDDIPAIVSDVNLDDRGLDDTPASFTDLGVLGRTVLVNGTPTPHLNVDAELVRLRLLNASTARSYRFGLADRRPVTLVGVDGGLLESPATVTDVRLTPGERAEILVRVRPGESVTLRSFPPRLGSTPALFDRFHGGDDTLDVLQLRAAATLRPAAALANRLAAPVDIDPATAAQTRRFRLAGHSINGRQMAMDRIDTVVTRGAVEIWQIENTDGMPHSFHIHDVRFRVLDPPDESYRGWKDTVYVPPGRTLRLAIRFDGAADPEHPYMYHCHKLTHEDHGMMGQFVVVEPGQPPALSHP